MVALNPTENSGKPHFAKAKIASGGTLLRSDIFRICCRQQRRPIWRTFTDEQLFRSEPIDKSWRVGRNQELRTLRRLSQTLYEAIQNVWMEAVIDLLYACQLRRMRVV
jgi:hypothetical protein